jgi:hypothetical protein
MRYIVGFARFWYEFIVGDDWRVALGVVVALALTEVLTHQGVAAWWLLPVAVVATLFASLRRATRQQ